MSIYLDASVLVSFFLADANSALAIAFLRRAHPSLVVSDFAAAEFVSAAARLVRTKERSLAAAQGALANLDRWRAVETASAETQPLDIAAADVILRRFDLVLRAPDAVNLVIARRIGAEIATFDRRMIDSAQALGIPVAAL